MQSERRTTRLHPRVLWLALVAVIVVAVVAAVIVTDIPILPKHTDDPKANQSVQPNADSDNDGITDQIETVGWQTQDGRTFVTDAARPDTDGDGLTDGEEAGPRSQNPNWQGAFLGVSDPTKADSDGDVLDDASEVDGGFDPWAPDSDGDELDDFEEIEFGSDPLSPNADDDHLDDAEELRDGNDPNAYDLTGTQAAQAFTVAFGAGDWEWGAEHLGRLNEQQLNSWQYLIGSVSRGIVPGADLTDVVANLIKGAWVAALISLVALVPVLGDGAKAGDAVLSFARKGSSAAQAAMTFVARNPALSSEAKADLTRRIVRLNPANARLPQDAAVRGTQAPAALPLSRPIARDAAQNTLKDEKVAELQELGYTDIRVNQQQVNANGERVGTNRPDIQATAPDGTREFWEYDTTSSARGPAHQTRILSNDDRAEVCLLNESDGYQTCA